MQKPFYSNVWDRVRTFPAVLSQGSSQAPATSGVAAAALVSAAFSCLALMVNQHLTSVYADWDKFIWHLGDWIPGSKTGDRYYGEIGSYSGKETVMLVSWLGSWALLHWLWRDREIKTQTIFVAMIGMLTAATVMNWHPFFAYLPLMPKLK